MLSKLLKYDLKWLYKTISIFYFLSFVFSLIVRGLSLLDKTFIVNSLTFMFKISAVGMIVATVIITVARLWTRFIKNVYKDESYLTHTLPVTKKDIYLAKVLSAVIASTTTVLVTLICLLICYHSKESCDFIKQSLGLIENTLDFDFVKTLVIMSFVLILELIIVTLNGYTGIILGFKSNRDKMIKTLICGFVSYLVTMVITLLIVYISSLINSNVMTLIKDNIGNVGTIKTLLSIIAIMYACFIFIFYFFGKNKLEEGVNID